VPDSGGFYKQVSPADPKAGSTYPSPPVPSNPSNFDFMLKEQPKPPRSFGLPSNWGKPTKLLALAGGILVVIILFAAVFGGGNSDSKQVLDLMARSQEIIRVSKLEDQKLKDSNVINLEATTETIMTSQQSELSAYLKRVKVKYKAKDLALYLNKATDVELESAAQNNNLDNAYVLYLKKSLAAYQNSLNTTYKITKSRSLKSALQSAYTSVGTFLKAPQFSS
jgi:hypothetical protein